MRCQWEALVLAFGTVRLERAPDWKEVMNHPQKLWWEQAKSDHAMFVQLRVTKQVNPEYAWPHGAPTHCPALYSFEIWTWLANHHQGHAFLKFVERAVLRFEKYA